MFPIKPFTNIIKAKPTSLILIVKRFLNKTHYDILGLSKNCTNKQIKDAFISLSKRFHPDKKHKESSHKEFVKILEAYNVLSKRESRNLYDWELSRRSSHTPNTQRPSSTRTTQTWEYKYDDPSFWRKGGHVHQEDEDNYYGIQGVKRVSNQVIASLCILLALFAGIMQIYAVRHSMTLRRDLLIKQSEEIGKVLAEIEDDKNKRSKEEQIEYMEARLLTNYKENL